MNEPVSRNHEHSLEELSAQLRHPELEPRLAALVLLAAEPTGGLSDQTLALLIGLLGAPRKLEQRRAAGALAALAGPDPRVLPLLRQALSSDNSRQRWGAAYTLGQIPGALEIAAGDALLEALSNPDGDVRWAAAELLVRLGRGGREAIRDGLLKLGENGATAGRKMALYCLRDLDCDDSRVSALAHQASLDHHPHVRLAALSLLSRMRHGAAESAEVALRCLYADSDHGVRRAAASALGRLELRSERILTALKSAAADASDGSLRKAAQQALERLEQSNGQ